MSSSVTPHPDLATPFKGNDRLILAIVLGVLTFWLFGQSVINIVPTLEHDLGISPSALNLSISLTSLFCGCFIVAAGGIADKVGRVKITYLGFVLSIIGCLCIIFANGTALFATGRIIQGLSGACIMPATLALVKTYYQGKDRQRALSFWVIGSWGGSGLCSLVGGAIATRMGWQWIFIFSIVFAVIGMLLMSGIPESKAEQEDNKSFDYLGLFTFVIMLLSLNLLITRGGSLGWTSLQTLLLAGLFVLATVAFFINSRTRGNNSFIDFALFKNRAYNGATLSNFLLNSLAGTIMVASMYMQKGRGFTPFETGQLTIGYLIAVLAMIRVGELLLQKVGAKKPMLWGTCMTGCAVGLMSLTFLPNQSYVIAVLIGYVLLGLGLGFYATPSTDTAVANAPADKIGSASGIYKMASSLGGAFGIAVASTVYAAFAAQGASVAASMTFLLNVAICLLAGVVLLIMVPKNAGK
ncbi:MFS transporter [Serratia microhaemolytica]|uniref:MFS transporter n=1 Tax=Serratia microhaemolytica TaxID=2675110 RepID=UPI000FDED7EE|nr:MFS transporter [Serratia microhaemolytica]